jgi:hypothetical protein
VHYLLAQLVCTFAVLVVGYVFNKIWTFGAAVVPTGATPLPRSEGSKPGVAGAVAGTIDGADADAAKALAALENTKS